MRRIAAVRTSDNVTPESRRASRTTVAAGAAIDKTGTKCRIGVNIPAGTIVDPWTKALIRCKFALE